MTRPRAADDFATIRARLEELRRERAQAFGRETDGNEPGEPNERILGGRGLLKRMEGRQKLENERWPAASAGRRSGSGR